VQRSRPLAGSFTPPGDKSITHRALLFGLLAEGTTRVSGANAGEDCAHSAACAAALGAEVTRTPDGWEVGGTGGRLVPPGEALECGNSGTTLRLLAGIVAARPFTSRLTGDASLSRRPMRRIAEPLIQMGAVVEGQGERCTPPLTVQGGRLRGIDYAVPMASAQVATCALLAGLAAEGETRVTLPGPARDHTERLLPAFGATLERRELAHGGREVRVRGGGVLRATHVAVPGDTSAAAFLRAAAAAEPGASVTARGVGLNPTRTAFLDVLREMGARVETSNARESAGEPLGDVCVSGPDRLRAFDVPEAWVPRMLDEVPAWVVVASAASGTSRLTGASELRVKESDRLAALAAGLQTLGIACDERPDGLAVTGGALERGGHIQAHLDHRIAMAFAALGTRAIASVWIDDVTSIATSFPGYLELLAELGAEITHGVAGGERT
jgi:3-phosphoshikimate 1-carboxyvinyltransferase